MSTRPRRLAARSTLKLRLRSATLFVAKHLSLKNQNERRVRSLITRPRRASRHHRPTRLVTVGDTAPNQPGRKRVLACA